MDKIFIRNNFSLPKNDPFNHNNFLDSSKKLEIIKQPINNKTYLTMKADVDSGFFLKKALYLIAVAMGGFAGISSLFITKDMK